MGARSPQQGDVSLELPALELLPHNQRLNAERGRYGIDERQQIPVFTAEPKPAGNAPLSLGLLKASDRVGLGGGGRLIEGRDPQRIRIQAQQLRIDVRARKYGSDLAQIPRNTLDALGDDGPLSRTLRGRQQTFEEIG